MTIIESNRLLADFMGYEGQHEEWCGNNVIREEPNFLPEGERLSPYRPEESWSDLMEVVEKIGKMGFRIEIYFSDEVNSVYIRKGEKINHVSSFTKPIRAMYTACVQFIQWFNTQKQ